MRKTYVAIYDREYSDNIVIKRADTFLNILADVAKGLGYSGPWVGDKVNFVIHTIARKLRKAERENGENEKIAICKISDRLVLEIKNKKMNDTMVIKAYIEKYGTKEDKHSFLWFVEEYNTTNIVDFDNNGDIIPNFNQNIIKDYEPYLNYIFKPQNYMDFLLEDEIEDIEEGYFLIHPKALSSNHLSMKYQMIKMGYNSDNEDNYLNVFLR